MDKQRKKILVGVGEKTALMKMFDCSYITIRQALSFNSNTLLAQKIRAMAIYRGGVVSDGTPKVTVL
jgi:hypothetical protein